jgi:hypothetical protein
MKLGHLSSVELLEVRIGNELRKYLVRHDLSPNRHVSASSSRSSKDFQDFFQHYIYNSAIFFDIFLLRILLTPLIPI